MSAFISGVGRTPFSRSSQTSSLGLNMAAIGAALVDAGIPSEGVDGIIGPAVVGASVDDLMTALGLEDLAFTANCQVGGAGFCAAVGLAAAMVDAGVCDNILVAFGYNGYSESRLGFKPPSIMSGESPRYRRNYEAVHGLLLPVQHYALWAARYMHEHGWKDADPLGRVAVQQRYMASRNEHAMRREEFTLDGYYDSRMISSPFRLLDCSQETDGAVAILVSGGPSDRGDVPTASQVQVSGWSMGKPPYPDQSPTRPNYLASAFEPAGTRAFTMADVEPSDVDFAEIYDPFTFHVIWQLESLGFAKHGRGRDTILAGSTALDGDLPVNTHGGLLSEGHVWGANHVYEAVMQLRGEAEGRQVDRAQVGVVTGTGDFGDASVLVLTK